MCDSFYITMIRKNVLLKTIPYVHRTKLRICKELLLSFDAGTDSEVRTRQQKLIERLLTVIRESQCPCPLNGPGDFLILASDSSPGCGCCNYNRSLLFTQSLLRSSMMRLVVCSNLLLSQWGCILLHLERSV